jgi:hypothetical protein
MLTNDLPLQIRLTEVPAGAGVNISSLTLGISVDAGAYTYYTPAAPELDYSELIASYDYVASYCPAVQFVGGQSIDYAVTVWDQAIPGNRGSAAFSVNIVAPPDTTPPWITRISPVDGAWEVSSNAQIRFSVVDSGSGVNWSTVVLTANGSNYSGSFLVRVPPTSSTCAFTPPVPYQTSPVAARVVAEDNAGNAATNAWSFYLVGGGVPDVNAPRVFPYNHTDGGTLLAGEPLQFRITEPPPETGAAVTTMTLGVSIDGGAFEYFREGSSGIGFAGNPYDGIVTYAPATSFEAGETIVYGVVVWDRATPSANRASTFFLVHVEWGVDATPPVVTVLAPLDGAMEITGRGPIRFSVTDDASGVDWESVVLTVNGVEYTIGEGSDLYRRSTSAGCTFIPSASYATSPVEVAVVARDYAGNAGTAEWSFHLAGTVVVPDRIVVADPGDGQGTTILGLPGGTTEVKVRTLLGVVVGVTEVEENAGSVVIDVSAERFASGLYVVEGADADGKMTYRALLLVGRR